MKPLTLLALAAALCVPACLMTVGDDGLELHSWDDWDDVLGDGWEGQTNCEVGGHSVRVDGDVVRVDGVRLRHQRWVETSHTASPGAPFEVGAASGPIELHGVPGSAAFHVLLCSEFEDDGHVAVEDGRLVAHAGRGAVFINGVRGNAPRDAALRVGSGSGPVELHDFCGPSLSVGSGTGSVSLFGCTAKGVVIESGTGDMTLEGGSADDARLSSGTADIAVRNVYLGSLLASSGTGDLLVSGCEIGRLQAESGTGDLRVSGGHVRELHHALGTGDLEITGGAQVGG